MKLSACIESLTPGEILWLLSLLLCLYLFFFYKAVGKSDFVAKPLPRPDNAPRLKGDTSMLFRYPDAITGKALFLQMNEAYFDAIFSAFLRSLQRAGYRLSDREPGIPPLLSGPTIDELAREVDRARQEFMTVLGTDIKDDVDYQMESGRAPKFLIQLIDSCERLGWKVVPAIQLPEDECVSSFSVSP